MGLITSIFHSLFGSNRNIVKETVEVFRPNAEAADQRSHDLDSAALAQLGAEFQAQDKGWFNSFMDGVNRLPRPLMVMGIFGVLVWTPYDPIGSAQVFTAWSLIPVEFWYIILAIVTFYFGGRHQAKAIDLQKSMANVATRVPAVLETIEALEDLRHDSPGVADTGTDTEMQAHALSSSENAAVDDWRKEQ